MNGSYGIRIPAAPALALFLSLTGCCTLAPMHTGLAARRSVHPAMLRILGSLAKGHKDKMQLAFLADFKGLSAPAGQFNSYMSESQGKLLNELQSWASRRHVQLRYVYRPALYGKAQKILAADEGGLLLHSNSTDFQKRYLIMMYMDYSWQFAMARAAQKQARLDHAGPGLMRYLTDAVAVDKKSLADLWTLLEQYHWANGR